MLDEESDDTSVRHLGEVIVQTRCVLFRMSPFRAHLADAREVNSRDIISRWGDGSGFDVRDFLGSLCSREPCSASGRAAREAGSRPRLTSSRLASAMKELECLEASVAEQIESVQMSADTEQASTQTRILTTERALQQYGETVAVLEQHAEDIVSYGRRVGVPLADLRQRSQKGHSAAVVLENLVVFSNNTDVSMLPELFHDGSRIEEAAEVVRLLMESIERVCDVRGESEGGRRGPSDCKVGSLFHAYSQLVLYLNILDNRIVSLFDAAVESKDVTCMAYHKRVMDTLHGSMLNPLLGSRYVSRRAVFIAPDEVLGDLSVASVGDVCARLGEYLRHEQAAAEQVFGQRDTRVMAMLVTRIFEETLADFLAGTFAHIKGAAAMDAGSTGAGASANLNAHASRLSDGDRDHAQLIGDSARKLYGLAEEALRITSRDGEDPPLITEELVEAAMGPALDVYEELERRWHTRIGRSLASGSRAASSPTSPRQAKAMSSIASISTSVALDLISMNEESVQRCLLVRRCSSRMIQRLFCSPALKDVPDSSLLDYMGTYLEHQVSAIAQESNKSLASSAIWTARGPASAPEDTLAVERLMDGSFVRVASCASTAADIVELVKKYHSRDIEPHLDSTAVATTRRSLMGLQKAVEHHVAMNLQTSIDTLALKIRDALYLAQQKSDFLTDASTCVATTTPPCRKICAILTAVTATMAKYLGPANMSAFSQALRSKMKQTLEQHILRYKYSREGGVRLKSLDLVAYSSCLRESSISDLIALSNVLIVEQQAVNELAVGLTVAFDAERVDRWVKRRAG